MVLVRLLFTCWQQHLQNCKHPVCAICCESWSACVLFTKATSFTKWEEILLLAHLLRSVFWSDLVKGHRKSGVLTCKEVREHFLSEGAFSFFIFGKNRRFFERRGRLLRKWTHYFLERPVKLLSHKVFCFLCRAVPSFPFLSWNIRVAILTHSDIN